jgi:hypothetical protein
MEIDADRGEGGANSSNNLHGSGRVNSTYFSKMEIDADNGGGVCELK